MAPHAAAACAFTAGKALVGVRSTGGEPPRSRRGTSAVRRRKAIRATSPGADFAAENADPVALRDRPVVELLNATGVRAADLCGLDLDAVDYSLRVIRVLGKGSRERAAPFGVPVERAVRRWAERGRSVLVSRDAFSALPPGVRDRRADARTAGRVVHDVVGVAPGSALLGQHRLRRPAAAHISEGGADLSTVQELLGHATLATTQLCTHVTVERLKAIHDRTHPRS
ncbi:tyrosine-type recombinase/integrase [Umezawaea sp.]|uniref:tyrosine-type recombinase/integrase n=1 Tax=Umezawaea sp. TaxID=1955258 RepID=UPI002ED22C98